MTAPDQWVWLARIRRPQGRKGEVFADLLTDFPEKFSERRRLWLVSADEAKRVASSRRRAGAGAPAGTPRPSHLGTRETTSVDQQALPAELIHHWLHKGGIVLHFAGIDSITAAEALKGLAVAIPRAERAPLAEDEAYIAELVDCTLVDVAGAAPREVGVIEDIDRSAGPAPLLIVRSASGEILVPFAKAYLRRIDLTAKRVEMALPEGLVDLNAE
jgi:16S rRNA processing protein RimM